MNWINLISGLIMGAVLATVATQFAITRVHEMIYWQDNHGQSYLALGDCWEAAGDCTPQIGWFVQ